MQSRRAIVTAGISVLSAAALGAIGWGVADATTSSHPSHVSTRAGETHATSANHTEDVVAGVFSTRGAARADVTLLDTRGFHGFSVEKEQARTTSSAAAGTGRSPIRGRHGALKKTTAAAGGAGARQHTNNASSTVGTGGTSTAGVRFEAVKGYSSKQAATTVATSLRHHGFHATVRAARR